MSKNKKSSKIPTFIMIIVILLLGGGIAAIYYFTKIVPENPSIDRLEFADPIYSKMTGLEISDEKLNNSPVFCVQIPNGSTDGARPQAGLTKAAVVFEAIAEMGITRFAAIFQNPDVSVIGPVRSLRPYYLDWDTPFDCTVTHAGGSDEALAAIRNGGQRNLDVDTNVYAWREEDTGRTWNNLFTSPTLLNDFNSRKGYTTSNPKTFPRLTPDDTKDLLEAREGCTEDSESEACDFAEANKIYVTFTGYNYSHNAIFEYDKTTNTYLRSHQDGAPHTAYECPGNLNQPITKVECGEPVRVAPSAVAVMRVQESTMADNYHESISSIGSGSALIFQNGEVIKGTWEKKSQKDQIVFKDGSGSEIKFTPGQLWISAVPQFGNVRYE